MSILHTLTHSSDQEGSFSVTLKQAQQVDPDPRSLTNLLTGISIYSNNRFDLVFSIFAPPVAELTHDLLYCDTLLEAFHKLKVA